tara:strand:- start:5758 stop:10620 length:4863 start_codon:yes stop_codon:yes gene_type:complete
MRLWLFIVLLIPIAVFLGSEAEAGCTGDQPPLSSDLNWIITQHTHCWDRDISVKDIEVNEGSFKLENVTLEATGKILLNQKTDWFESTIIHNTTTNSNLLDINAVVTIKGTNLTINAPEHVYGGSGFQGMKLSANSKLIITDMDNDPTTTHDVSNISSMSWNVSDPYMTALEFWGWGNDQTVEFSNSVFHHLFAVRTTGDNVIVRNNSFYYCGTIAFANGDNMIFENNYAYNNSYGTNYGAWFIDYYGNNGTIRNNFIEESDGAGIFVDSGYNYTLNNNTFLNVTSENIGGFGQFSASNVEGARWYNNTLINVDSFGFWLNNATNSSVSYNVLNNVTEGLIGGGENLTIHNNVLDECGWNWYAGVVGGCISVGGGSLPIDVGNITIYSNNISNIEQVGIMVYTGENLVNNIQVYNNTVQGGLYGFLMTTYGSFAERPENVTVNNNDFYDNTNGIGIYKSYTAKGGANNLIIDNKIYNSTTGIRLDGTPTSYEGIIIASNYIEANVTGIFIGDIVSPHVVNNTVEASIGIDCAQTDQMNIQYNTISVKTKGFTSSYCKGEILKNEINGACNSDDCSKVAFTKVAALGAEFDEYSDLEFNYNNLTLFDIHVRVVNSELEIENNVLDYGNVGILFEETDNISIRYNLIYNNSISINLINSFDIEIEMNNLSNFEKGIHSINSSSNILTNYYDQGLVCLDFLDSEYQVNNYDNFGCTTAYILESYNVRINIVTDEGVPSPNHQFYYYNDFDTTKIYSSTYETGFSDYIELRTTKVDNSGLNIDFNNYHFGYYHNDILNLIEQNIDTNRTITAYLDVIPPSTLLYCDSPLVKTNNIPIYLNIVDGAEDFRDYDIYYLQNDGINFAEWTLFGTFNQTTVYFNGDDSTKYRFKSISRDIYGNVEAKSGYDYEVHVDTTVPNSFFEGLKSNYYFEEQNEILLSWNSDYPDVSLYSIEIYYTNFTNAYLNPSAVIWDLNSSYEYFSEDSLVYTMGEIGHYGFKIIAQDEAGNVEAKNTYDFIVNYDPSSDSLSLIDVPNRWGEENLTIVYQSSDTNLEFDIYIALESVNNPAHTLAWYYYSQDDAEGIIQLSGLQDSMRYYLVIKSLDLAGNVEDPLNTTEIYSSNGTYDQFVDLEYVPLSKDGILFTIMVDEDLDGIYEKSLTQGDNQSRLNGDEFFVDYLNQRVIFGGAKNGGYVPSEGDENIKIKYSGVHSIFEIYTANPTPARDLAISHTNVSNMVVTFEIEADLAICKVQRTTDKANGWFNEMIISPCEKGVHDYVEEDPDPTKTYYYRIWTENEFGHSSVSDERTIVMEEVIKFYETNEKTSSNQFGITGILPLMLGVGIVLLASGGILLYRSKNQEIDDNIQLIESKPIAKFKIEQVYLIYQDGRLLEYVGTGESQTDTDIMSGMLTAINDFVQDSFQSTGDLGAIDYGDNTVVLQRGKNCYLAAVVYGEVDKFLRSKLANIVRVFEGQNPKLNQWNGDVEQIVGSKQGLDSLIQETITANREMVDNYLSEKEIVVNTTVDRQTDRVKLSISISNYSSEVIENCSLSPVFNSALLAISNIKPDISYSFADNAFYIGDLGSFNEINFDLELIIRAGNPTDMELDLVHTHKGRELKSNNKISLI